MVDAEPPERPVEVGQEPAPRGVGLALAAAARDAALGREHDLVAGDHVADQPADQLLRRPVGVPGGGVDQRAARLREGDQLVTGLVLVGVPTPRHGSQAEPRDREARGTDRPLLHAPKGSRSPARGGRAARWSIRALAWVRPHHSRRRKARDELLRRHHPRHRGRADRVPPDLQHRPPDDRGAAPRAAGRRPGGDRLHRRHPDGRHRGGDPLLRARHLGDHQDLGARPGPAGVARSPRLPDGLVRHRRHHPGRPGRARLPGLHQERPAQPVGRRVRADPLERGDVGRRARRHARTAARSS